MPRHQSIVVRATRDAEAGVWVATSDDVPGLVAEADTFDELRDTVLTRISELIELNGSTSSLPEIPVHILAEQFDLVANPSPAS